jgi:hypothetical protein
MEICDRAGISDIAKEEIWNATKYLLSEKTELLINRHIDQMIICTIYGVCKLNQIQLTFNAIISAYTELYEDERETVISKVWLETGETVDIIKFYNYVYIQPMKVFLINMKKGSVPAKPRIGTLSPASPLRANLPSPMLHYSSLRSSPMMTPMTKRLFAVGESPSQLRVTSGFQVQAKSARRIAFDTEELRYKG